MRCRISYNFDTENFYRKSEDVIVSWYNNKIRFMLVDDVTLLEKTLQNQLHLLSFADHILSIIRKKYGPHFQ